MHGFAGRLATLCHSCFSWLSTLSRNRPSKERQKPRTSRIMGRIGSSMVNNSQPVKN